MRDPAKADLDAGAVTLTLPEAATGHTTADW
jgi:hypothetical protein